MTDLTEQWKKGELPAGCYYIKLNYNDTIIMADSWSDQTFTLDDHEYGIDEVKEVLAKVPTYSEYLALQSDSLAKNEGAEIIAELEEDNKKLKELLKEAYPVIDYADGAARSPWEKNWLAKADEVLK